MSSGEKWAYFLGFWTLPAMAFAWYLLALANEWRKDHLFMLGRIGSEKAFARFRWSEDRSVAAVRLPRGRFFMFNARPLRWVQRRFAKEAS